MRGRREGAALTGGPDPTSRARLQRESWSANAAAWTEAVRTGRIESRRAATDAAVLEHLAALKPRRVLDVGCGEGWLCRALATRGVEPVGIDGSEELVERARESGGGTFLHLTFAELAARPERVPGPFDVVICNFSLLDEDLVPLLAALRRLTGTGGALVIQTVHPWSACGDAPYRDGWRVERFDAFGTGFGTPMPWHFRTLESWFAVLAAAGWEIRSVGEPRHPESGVPLSLLLHCEPRATPGI